jgi:two-component system NtrC family sensor kinase
MASNNSRRDGLQGDPQVPPVPQIELDQARAHLETILAYSEDLIFAADTDGVLGSFSKGGERILGYTWDQVAGRRIHDFTADLPALEELMESARGEVPTAQRELAFRHKDDHIVYCNVSLIHLKDRDGRCSGILGICRDTTLQKQLQEELIRIDRLAEIGRLASGIVHEINNPLAVIAEISGWAGSVVSDAKGLSPEDRSELETAVQRIGEQTSRCRNITRRILGFARYSAPSKTSFDINELLKETITFLDTELRHEQIVVEFAPQEDHLIIHSDPKMLEQVFVNLITNAIHAVKVKASGTGRIELRVKQAGPRAEIVVSDNGIGIRPEDSEKIFNLFYTTKPPGKGTGLGLPICRQIIMELGGEFGFESRTGEGTTFTIRMPLP